MNAITQKEAAALAPMSELDLIRVLQSSLYPGASADSIRMVIEYCRASSLDPFQKPVHIVPMWDSKAGQMRDVVMPGVGLYRTQASRSQQMAGISEPEFGPMVTEKLGGQEITFPEWCKVTVRRQIASGIVADFTAIEYWLENYAIKGGKEKSVAPNAMWSKRPRGQLAKCAEAQALRKAFPEVGAAPTADEMEGKQLHPDDVPVPAPRVEAEVIDAAPVWPAESFELQFVRYRKAVESGAKTASEIKTLALSKGRLTAEQEARINALAPIQQPEVGAAADQPE